MEKDRNLEKGFQEKAQELGVDWQTMVAKLKEGKNDVEVATELAVSPPKITYLRGYYEEISSAAEKEVP